MSVYFFYPWFIFVFISFLLITFCYMHFSEKKDLLNNIVGFGALFFVFFHVLMFLLLMFQNEKVRNVVLPQFLISTYLPLLLIGISVLISTIFFFLFKISKKSKDNSKFGDHIITKLQSFSETRKDLFRKMWHIFIFIGLFVLWYLSYDFVRTQMSKNKKPKIEPKTTNMLYLYLRILTTSNSIKNVLYSLEWFYYVIFFFFYSFTLIMLTNEYTRKTKYLHFPFNFVGVLLSEEEKRNYGTYLYFAIGHMFAAFVCPPMAFFTILAMSSIGDLIPSQIGMRFGKVHIPWNKKKTFEGTIVGTLGAYLLCVIFVGFIYAFIFAILFMVIDLFTRKPLDISDNLLIPIGSAVLFLLVRFYFDFDYTPIILNFL